MESDRLRYVLLVVMGIAALAAVRIQAASNGGLTVQSISEREEAEQRLLAEDKAQVIEFLRVGKTFGSRIWHGFDEAGIPLILYNDHVEFLIGHPNPPPPWEAVSGDTVQGHVYYRRDIEQDQAFAVPVGDLWAGSLSTLGSLARSMEDELKERVPPDKLTPVFIKMMTPTPAQHVIYSLHEAFHAFQALRFNDRFQKAKGVYASEEHYPFEDEGFMNAWNVEGALLISALREEDESERLGWIAKFIEARSRRRSQASLAPDLVEFERALEWLEGLAKYAEMRFAELCASEDTNAWIKDYRVVRNRTRMDFYARLNRAGELRGDLRFYLSGAAQAMLLDLISRDWKQEMASRPGSALEDLLRSDHSK